VALEKQTHVNSLKIVTNWDFSQECLYTQWEKDFWI